MSIGDFRVTSIYTYKNGVFRYPDISLDDMIPFSKLVGFLYCRDWEDSFNPSRTVTGIEYKVGEDPLYGFKIFPEREVPLSAPMAVSHLWVLHKDFFFPDCTRECPPDVVQKVLDSFLDLKKNPDLPYRKILFPYCD